MASIKHLRILFLLSATFFLTGSVYSQTWIASPQIVGEDAGGDTISGYVFHDINQNGIMDEEETGVSGVLVSNGNDWVRTDENGFYSIAVETDMNLTIVQPSSWRVPTDHRADSIRLMNSIKFTIWLKDGKHCRSQGILIQPKIMHRDSFLTVGKKIQGLAPFHFDM